MTTVGFDPEARLRLALDRTVPDNGEEQLVEAILRDVDGTLELGLWDEDGCSVGSITLRQDFLDALIATGHPLADGREAAA